MRRHIKNPQKRNSQNRYFYQYENSKWFEEIKNESDLYLRRFLSISFVIGLLIPAAIGIESLRLHEYWNLKSIFIAEIVLGIILVATRVVSRKGIEYLRYLVLAAYPLAYFLCALSPGSHQTYVIILLCMPPLFDVLAPARQYLRWLAYAVAIVAATAFSFLAGISSMWGRDFSLGGILTIHASFFVTWVLIYVTRRQMQYYMNRLAGFVVTDQTTGLPSIAAFRESLKRGETTLVSIITVGNYGELSTLFGYFFAENVLKTAAVRLAEGAKTLNGKVFRLRSNDFGFLRVMSESDEEAEIIQRLQKSLAGPLVMQNKTIELSYRIGYTVSINGDVENALNEADEALKKAEEGGLAIARYDGDSGRLATVEASVESLMTLSRNVSEKTLSVFYQPVISLPAGKIAWNEALVRFKGNDGNYEEPARYLTLASTTGHWAAIEDFVMDRAISRACGSGGPVSVNVSLKDLNRTPLRSVIEAGAQRARNAGSSLILEILEGDFGNADNKLFGILQSLRAAGCLIAIDDFGTGYSNYSRLMTFPVDIVKFDRSLVQKAVGDNAVATLVEGLAGFCSDVGALTVAEGIETEECADFFAAIGFDFGQGFYWSRPVHEADSVPAELTTSLARRLARL